MITRRLDFGASSSWCDVAGDVFAYASGKSVVFVRVGPLLEIAVICIVPLPEAPMFVRVAEDPDSGDAAAFAKGHDSGTGYLVLMSGAIPLGSTHGNNPGAILYDGTEFVVRWVESPGVLATRFADGPPRREPIPPAPDGQHSSAGILDIGADGSIIWMDQRRATKAGAWTLTKPIFRSGIVVGQSDPSAIRVAVGDRVFTAIDAPDGMAEDPHLSVLPNGRLLVSAFTSRGASLSIIDVPYPDGELPPVNVPAIGRPLWVAWFAFGPTDAPGNALLRVDGEMLVRDRAGRVIAQYVDAEREGPSLEALDRAIRAARVARPDVPVLAYWPEAVHAQGVPSADLVGVEAYCRLTETMESFESRVWWAIRRCARAWIVAQAYTSNATQTTDLRALVPVYARLANRPNVEGIVAFSAGAGRRTGYEDHPEVHDAWSDLVDGVAGTPALPSPPVPSRPPSNPAPPDPVPAHHPDPPPPPAPTPTIGDFLMFSTFTDPTKRVLAVQSVKSLPGGLFVLKNPDGRVVSIQPDGSVQDRPGDADGGYERCKIAGNAATFKPVDGKYYTFAFVLVDGL